MNDHDEPKVKWLPTPEDHDYPAAVAYLGLIETPTAAERHGRNLAQQPITFHKAKDILRATKLQLLPKNNTHVTADLKKIRDGQHLSPVLIIRGTLDRPAHIADGYHRVCASYWTDENTDIPTQII